MNRMLRHHLQQTAQQTSYTNDSTNDFRKANSERTSLIRMVQCKKMYLSLLPIAILILVQIHFYNDIAISSSFVEASQPKLGSSVPCYERKALKASKNEEPAELPKRKTFRLIQVQVVHRHGDRTPITPMKDESFWRGTLPSPALLTKLADGTSIKRDNDSNGGSAHAAGGRGPFGKLTQLGLLQMVEVGSRLRDQLFLDTGDDTDHNVDDEGNIFLKKGRLFTPNAPLHPNNLKIKSTDFPRTVQSVQALLLGLFPDGLPDNSQIEIDARHTDKLIPDPQPRTSVEQMELEKSLSQRQYLLDREGTLKSLVVKLSKELKPFVSDDATKISFGIGEEGDAGLKEERPLSWSQLSEIMTCLKVRDLLPGSITQEEFQTTTTHSAWKWFENLKDSRLSYLAMKSFMDFIMGTLQQARNQEDTSMLHIYSAHDSSLIGLMCAFRLQQPSQWPEYGSFLTIELYEADSAMCHNNMDNEKEYYVRFALNNNVLKSTWGLGEGEYLEPKDMIPLDHLETSIRKEHGH